MYKPVKKDLTAYQNADFLQGYVFSYDITNVAFYSQLVEVNADNTETVIADFSITKDLNTNTIWLKLSKSQISGLEIGKSYKYDVKQVSEIEVFLITGSFKVKNTYTVLP